MKPLRNERNEATSRRTLNMFLNCEIIFLAKLVFLPLGRTFKPVFRRQRFVSSSARAGQKKKETKNLVMHYLCASQMNQVAQHPTNSPKHEGFTGAPHSIDDKDA